MGVAEAVILTIITAATPLLLAAIGELVVERSGVLNLGVEGMMVMGAVCGFGAAYLTGNPFVGVIASIVAGVVMSILFGILTLSLVALVFLPAQLPFYLTPNRRYQNQIRVGSYGLLLGCFVLAFP